MNLVERERELAELSDVLAECARGRGSAVVISGGIGTGKTELLDALKGRGVEAGFMVLGAVSSWAERDSPGSVLSQLLRQAEDPLGPACRTAELLDQLVRAYPTQDTEDSGQSTYDSVTTAALHRLCTRALQVADRIPVLLCIDDVQFADALTRHWLIQLLRQMRSSRIALVVAECTLSAPANPQLRAELLRVPNYRRITVERLTRDGVAEMLADHLDDGTATALADPCHEVSAGNPLLVRALVEDHLSAASAPDGAAPELAVADAHRDAVLACLHRGWPGLVRLAEALAVLDADAELPDLLTQMMEDEEPATIERGLYALDAAGLLKGKRLRHPATRSVVLESLTPHRRAALHGRVAGLLYEQGVAATRVARHLLAAERGLPPWAVPVLREAAERHLVGNRAADAHACLDAALRVCDDDSLRMDLKVLLASAAWLLNPSISAKHLGELAAALREGRLPDRTALMLAKYLLWHGRFDEAADAIELIGEREDETDPAGAVEVRATRELLSSSYPALVSPTVRNRPHPQSGTVYRGSADRDPRIRGAAALSHVLRHGPDDGAVADAETSMRATRLGKKTQEWLMCAVAALKFADRLDTAGSWCDHWLEEARARRVPLWEAEFASLRASISLRQGDPVRARQLAETALAQVPAESWGVCLGGPLANLVQASTDTGDYDAAAAYLEVPVPEGMFKSRFGLSYLDARGWYHLRTGRPYAALDDFTTCGELMRRWGFDQPSLVTWRTGAAQAHLALGDTLRARRLARDQIAIVGAAPTRSRGVALRSVAATSPPADRVDLLTEAVQILQSCGDQLQLAGAFADLGRVHLQGGRPAKAKPLLELAARLAEACGAEPLLQTLRAEGVAPTGDPPGPASRMDRAAALVLLSGAERRVADLAVRGYSNKQISEKLNITVSTVEQHLTRVFRKLGVKARKDLPDEIVLAMGTP